MAKKQKFYTPEFKKQIVNLYNIGENRKMLFSVSVKLIPYPVRSYFLATKKCRIYAACGVSQTPMSFIIMEVVYESGCGQK